MSGLAFAAWKDCHSIANIIDTLRVYIVDEPSDVVESKLAALSFDRYNLSSFCDELEKLLGKLQVSLVAEGVSYHKAQQMTIKRAVESCRMCAKNDLVKSVIASSTYATYRDVLSKFRTEISDQRRENMLRVAQDNRYGNRFHTPPRNTYAPRFPQNNSNNVSHTNYRNNYNRQFQQRPSTANIRVMSNPENVQAPAAWLANDLENQEGPST